MTAMTAQRAICLVCILGCCLITEAQEKLAANRTAKSGPDETPYSPPYRPRNLRQMAAMMVAWRNSALKDPDVFKVSVGFSNAADVKIPKGAKDCLPYIKRAGSRIKANGGGVWIFEQGTYLVSEGFYVTASDTHILGAGIDKTIIKVMDSAPVWSSPGILHSRGNSRISVTDITFDGNKAKQDPKKSINRYGNYLDLYKDLIFQRVKIANFQRYGFDPHGMDKVKWSDGLVVLDCIAMDNQWDGFTFDQQFNIYAKNNTAIGNGRHGFNIITGSRNVLVEGNVAINNGFGPPAISHNGNGCGFMTDSGFGLSTEDVVYQSNRAQKSKAGGFCVKDVERITIRNNRITTAGSCLSVSDGSTEVVFSSNVCSHNNDKFRFKNADPKEVTATGNVFN